VRNLQVSSLLWSVIDGDSCKFWRGMCRARTHTRARAHTHTHTQTHVQLSLEMYNCWNAVNLNDGVHLRNKCDLKDIFPSRDWEKTQSLYLTTGRSYPEDWNFERNPISLQKLKFSLKFNVLRLSAIWSCF
jgi:hypothetical protein